MSNVQRPASQHLQRVVPTGLVAAQLLRSPAYRLPCLVRILFGPCTAVLPFNIASSCSPQAVSHNQSLLSTYSRSFQQTLCWQLRAFSMFALFT